MLILGSMPGIKSLEAQQYYAHPQNAFWHIMSSLFDAQIDTYAQRVKLIKDNHLALWDVLKCCERHGSLDMRIDDYTIEVNDFAAFFNGHPAIHDVFCNGGKSHAEFRKRVLPALSEKIRENLRIHRLPSTSSAMAGMSRTQKLTAWRAVNNALKKT